MIGKYYISVHMVLINLPACCRPAVSDGACGNNNVVLTDVMASLLKLFIQCFLYLVKLW